jgi:hypothetical protein
MVSKVQPDECRPRDRKAVRLLVKHRLTQEPTISGAAAHVGQCVLQIDLRPDLSEVDR